VIYQVDPEFSDQARAAGVGGEVLVNLIVDSHGVPQNVHVLRGVGMGLDETAVDAVKQYRFEPAMEGDKPVAVQLSVVVNFQIFRSPTVIHSVPLHYSSEARKNKASGDILVGLTVDEKGLPQNVHILRGFGMGMDEQAVAAVQRYKFKPFTQGGKPVARPATLQINFDAAN
jgi:TonB family protein